MSLTVPAEMVERAQRGRIEERDFVSVVRKSLPRAWRIVEGLASAMEAHPYGWASMAGMLEQNSYVGAWAAREWRKSTASELAVAPARLTGKLWHPSARLESKVLTEVFFTHLDVHACRARRRH